MARGISEQFEFALALLDGSRGAKADEGSGAARMAADRTQGPLRSNGCERSAYLFTGCVTEGLFKRVKRSDQTSVGDQRQPNKCAADTNVLWRAPCACGRS